MRPRVREYIIERIGMRFVFGRTEGASLRADIIHYCPKSRLVKPVIHAAESADSLDSCRNHTDETYFQQIYKALQDIKNAYPRGIIGRRRVEATALRGLF